MLYEDYERIGWSYNHSLASYDEEVKEDKFFRFRETFKKYNVREYYYVPNYRPEGKPNADIGGYEGTCLLFIDGVEIRVW